MLKNKIIANFTGVSAFIVLSKLLGFLRDIFMAACIGTTALSDAYTQIFGVPTLLFASMGMALSSVNIPNMTYYISHRSDEERSEYVSNLYTQLTLFGFIISIAGIILAPFITRLILPGLSEGLMNTAVTLTRIMFPTLLFICLAYVTAGILQVHKHFIASSVISIPYNLVIIGCLLLLRQNTAYNIAILGLATTVGWLLQFLVQLPVFRKEKYRLGPVIDLKNEHTKDIYRQLVPILLGNAALQLCLLTGRAFATHLEEGSAAALAFGSFLFMTVTGIFVVAMSTVTFPELSKYCLEKNFEKIRALIGFIFKILLIILIPYLIIVLIYHREIIELVYQRGSFTARSTGMTSRAFLIYSFCIVGYVSQEIFNRLYYALKKFNTPMFMSIGCVVLNAMLALLLYRYLGIDGIAGSTALSFIAYAVVMGILVKREIGPFLGKEFGRFSLKLLLPVTGMVSIFLAFKLFNFQGMIKSLVLPVAAGGFAYLLLLRREHEIWNLINLKI